MHAFPPPAEFSFKFTQASQGELSAGELAIPVLAGEPSETLFAGLIAAGCETDFELFASEDWLVGRLVVPLRADVSAQSEELYANLLALVCARGRQLVRVWNYVGGINRDSAEGMETYQAFCRGRSLAFEQAGWTNPLPAASAVGGADGVIAIQFAAAREKPRAYENPEQMPAFQYPADYGPRSPSFSRAMQVNADGRRWTFVSGTAAIKGHVSMATGDLDAQIACTLDNLRLVSVACGLGETLGAASGLQRHFKIYLRHRTDLDVAMSRLNGTLLRAADRVSWLQSDICRADLLIEIEATVIG